MKMSRRRSTLEGGSVTQHRPQDVNPPPGEGDQWLDVPFAFGPLPIVEGSGLRGPAQAGEGGLVEDSFEKLVSASHPTVVSRPLTGVVGSGDQPCVGGELIGAVEGGEVSCCDQELRSEDRPHIRQASKDRRLRTGEKTLPNLLVDALDAVLEEEHLFGELGGDARGDIFGG